VTGVRNINCQLLFCVTVVRTLAASSYSMPVVRNIDYLLFLLPKVFRNPNCPLLICVTVVRNINCLLLFCVIVLRTSAACSYS